jgi:mannose-1-phosphate guanylyltransferase
MKVFLLAAGLGTRLRPLTDSVPKCLVPLNGKPLLEYWFILFRKYGIREVLINLHHLQGQVNDFLASSTNPFLVRTFYEETLLGSAGTVWANRDWVAEDDAFMIAYADNLTNADLGGMIDFHKKGNSILTVGLFETTAPHECGIALMDAENTITDFIEKPRIPRSNLASAGIFIATPHIFQYFKDEYPQDFGFDVLPRLIHRMKGFVIKESLIDIGDIRRYEQAQKVVRHMAF